MLKLHQATTTMTLSRTRIAGGVAGPTVELTDATSAQVHGVIATMYMCKDMISGNELR